jgi:hypothetical protein
LNASFALAVDVLNDLRVDKCVALGREIGLGGLHRSILVVNEQGATKESISSKKFKLFSRDSFRPVDLDPERVHSNANLDPLLLLPREHFSIPVALVANHALSSSISLAFSSLCNAHVCIRHDNDLVVTERPIQSCSTPRSKAASKSNMLSQIDAVRTC